MAEPLAIAARLIDTLIAERDAERARAEAAEAEARALRDRLAAAHNVIRKAQDLIHTVPLTSDEEKALGAATADPTPDPETHDD